MAFADAIYSAIILEIAFMYWSWNILFSWVWSFTDFTASGHVNWTAIVAEN